MNIILKPEKIRVSRILVVFIVSYCGKMVPISPMLLDYLSLIIHIKEYLRI